MSNLPKDKESLDRICSYRDECVSTSLKGLIHKINNHLQVLMTGFDTLSLFTKKEDWDKEKIRKRVKSLKEAIDSLTRTISSVSLCYLPDPLSFDRAPFDLSIMMEALERVQQTHGVDLVFDIRSSKEVECYPNEIAQAVFALLRNAAAKVADQEENWIKIILEVEGDKQLLVVADSAQEDCSDQWMEPYYTTKNPEEHLGLGLYWAKSLIERNGGEFNFSTRENMKCFLISFKIN